MSVHAIKLLLYTEKNSEISDIKKKTLSLRVPMETISLTCLE